MEEGEQPPAQRMSVCTCTQAGSDGLRSSLNMHVLHGKQDLLRTNGEVVVHKVNDDRGTEERLPL